jgi:nitrogen fixation NifU-like protein
MKIELKIEEDVIVDCKHKVFGCGSAISSSSYVTELIKNKRIEEVEQITNKDIAKHLNLPPVKLHCSMLAEDAIKNAIQKYKIVKEKKAQKKRLFLFLQMMAVPAMNVPTCA